MNNAKEKAKELFEKYYQIGKNHDFDYAKDCALIAVDEIINEFYTHPVAKMYWQEVKQEIQKL
jgi:hypothetical protein